MAKHPYFSNRKEYLKLSKINRYQTKIMNSKEYKDYVKRRKLKRLKKRKVKRMRNPYYVKGRKWKGKWKSNKNRRWRNKRGYYAWFFQRKGPFRKRFKDHRNHDIKAGLHESYSNLKHRRDAHLSFAKNAYRYNRPKKGRMHFSIGYRLNNMVAARIRYAKRMKRRRW